MARYPFQNPQFASGITASSSVTFGPSVIYVGGAGNLKVKPVQGASSVTFNNLSAGQDLPLKVNKVFASGTTCSGIIRMW